MYVFVICVFSCLHVFVFSICGMCVCCFSVFLLYVVGVLCSVSFTINVIISVLLCVFFFFVLSFVRCSFPLFFCGGRGSAWNFSAHLLFRHARGGFVDR